MEKPLQNREGVGVGNEFSCCQNCCLWPPNGRTPLVTREERNVGDTICKVQLPQTQSMADKGREQFFGCFLEGMMRWDVENKENPTYLRYVLKVQYSRRRHSKLLIQVYLMENGNMEINGFGSPSMI